MHGTLRRWPNYAIKELHGKPWQNDLYVEINVSVVIIAFQNIKLLNEKSASLSSRASRSCDIYITVGQFNTEQARSIVFKRGGGANSYKKSSRAKIIIIIINLNLLFYMQMMRNLKKIINCLKSVLCKWSLRNK